MLLSSKTFVISKTAGKIKILKERASPTAYCHYHLHHQGRGSEIYTPHTGINVMKISLDYNTFPPANVVIHTVEFA
jgi:hypothetical protein